MISNNYLWLILCYSPPCSDMCCHYSSAAVCQVFEEDQKHAWTVCLDLRIKVHCVSGGLTITYRWGAQHTAGQRAITMLTLFSGISHTKPENQHFDKTAAMKSPALKQTAHNVFMFYSSSDKTNKNSLVLSLQVLKSPHNLILNINSLFPYLILLSSLSTFPFCFFRQLVFFDQFSEQPFRRFFLKQAFKCNLNNTSS